MREIHFAIFTDMTDRIFAAAQIRMQLIVEGEG